jgi:FkbM family methyltransferase
VRGSVAFVHGRRWRQAEKAYFHLLDGYARCRHDFFFVQVGANDGIYNDPMYERVRANGWHGVLIEPQPDVFTRLKLNYEGCSGLVFENVAVTSDPGLVTLYRPKGGSHTGIATVLPDRGDMKGLELEEMERIQVPALRLNTVLHRHLPKRWDLLQIDTEGYDFEVIKMVEFDVTAPAIVVYEHRHLSLVDRWRCRRFLRKRGYSVVATMERDTAAVRKSVLEER